VASQSLFRIADASRVRWEWYDYGAPRTEANLYFQEFEKCPDGISVRSNAPWEVSASSPVASLPAAEAL
jgi:hypothetical protein